MLAAARLTLVALLVVLAGCGTSNSGGQPKAATSHGVVVCPTPSVKSQPFPSSASSALPRPTFSESPQLLPSGVSGVTLLRFTTQMSLRDAVIFLLKNYPAAGYVLGRGDSEVNEADAPFARGTEHGTTRLSAIAPCTTTWLVAVTQPGASLGNVPQLAPHTTSSSPLPFGQ